MNDVAAFREQGYRVFAEALDQRQLGQLQGICDQLLAEPVDDGGKAGRLKLGLGQARRFLAHRHQDFPELEAFVLGSIAKSVTESCLGSQAMLFNEQFVVKGSGKGASFAWHQDSAYVGYDHDAYLTVWIALDNATEDNGCIYLLPRNLNEQPGIDRHEWQEESRELNGYFGKDQGLAMTCQAGTILAFSSRTLHRSGPNTTDKPRRAYVCQYSLTPIQDPETGELKRFATPLH